MRDRERAHQKLAITNGAFPTFPQPKEANLTFANHPWHRKPETKKENGGYVFSPITPIPSVGWVLCLLGGVFGIPCLC